MKRGTEIPDDFAVTPQMKEWANEKIIGLDIGHETDKFESYYRANARRFVRWDQAWRNWLLKAVEFKRAREIRDSARFGDKSENNRRSTLTQAVLDRKNRRE
jgi:hypothetical protein